MGEREPVKVHGPAMSTCVARVLVVLEEKGVEYQVFPIDLAAKEQKLPSHVARNPFGQVPALEDGDLTLFESRAITKYIARKYKDIGPDLLREGSLEEAAMVEVWMEVEAQQYNPAVFPIVYQILVAPRRGGVPNEQLIAAGAEKLAKVLDVYEERLSRAKYLAGDFFSLADLHHLPFTYYLMATPHASLVTSRPHVKAWWEDLSSRPACRKITEGMTYARPIGEGA